MVREHHIELPSASTENQIAPEPEPAPVLQDQIPECLVFQPCQNQSREIEPLHTKAFRKPEAQLKYPKLGEITDLQGTVWDVREIRPTKHNFDIYYGTPTSDCGAFRGRKPHLIASVNLLEFWHANCTRGRGFLFDLPAGYSTLKSLRARVGFSFRDDVDAFWEDRTDDLMSLSSNQFAARHGVSRGSARDRRRRILGSTARARGWWRKPGVAALLLSGQTLNKIGNKLGISTSQVSRLRARARQESQEANNRFNSKLVSFPTFPGRPKPGDYEPPLAA